MVEGGEASNKSRLGPDFLLSSLDFLWEGLGSTWIQLASNRRKLSSAFCVFSLMYWLEQGRKGDKEGRDAFPCFRAGHWGQRAGQGRGLERITGCFSFGELDLDHYLI